MRIYQSLEELEGPIALTIGNFDGVHRGHTHLFEIMRQFTGHAGSLHVVTFSIHPSYVLPHLEKIDRICSNSLKMRFLQESGIDLTYSIPFTEELSKLSYEDFLEELRPFDLLFLGKGATLGKKREGTEEKIHELGEKWGFKAHFIDKVAGISSGQVRKAILEGALDAAAEMLGRPYTLLGSQNKGTVEVDLDLCLPPQGEYPVIVKTKEGAFSANCHLGDTISLSLPIEGEVEILFL